MPRDYKAEYRRRVARALARGLTRSQARGHSRSGENSLRTKPVAPDEKLEAAPPSPLTRAQTAIAKLSDAQKDHPALNDRNERFLETVGHFLLGLADLCRVLVEKLTEFGLELIRCSAGAVEKAGV